MKKTELVIWSAALAVCLLAAGAASAQNTQPVLTVTYPSGFGVSQPVSQILAPTSATPVVQTIIPLRALPPKGGGALAPNQPDQALQSAAGEPLELDDDGGGGRARFPGVGANGFAPPDTNMAVGPNHIVQIVNVQFAVYNKSGAIFAGYPKPVGAVFSAIGGGCAGAFGDVIAQYDKVADRWLISQLGSFGNGLECIAVSQTNDPTGAYNLYSYSFGTNFNDYPKIAVWPVATNSAFLATYNIFNSGGGFVGSELCAYDRAAMLSGAASPAAICTIISNDASYLPSDLDGSTVPPSGTAGYFLTFETLSSLRYYQLSPNFANPGASTLSAATDITVAAFSEACGGGTCIPQPGTTQQLDSLGDRPMYRLAYRNFGDHQAVVVNHSVTAGSSVGVRWYELRGPLGGAFSLFQQGTFAPDATFRWMGSAAMDQAGDIGIGYSASSSSVAPSIRVTGRAPTDAVGTLRAETSLLAGTGSQTGGLSRWGDYSAIRIDPSDDCTFWYTNQYEPSSGSFNWATFVGSFKFTTCGTTGADFSLTATPASQTVVPGSATSYTATVTGSGGFAGTVSLSASGLPTGATATFSPASITGSGSSTMNVTTLSTTAAGTYTVTVTGTSGALSHSTTVTLVVSAAANFSITATPASRTVTQGTATTYTATVTGSGGFAGTVSLSASGLPSGASATFSPTSVTGSGSSTMNVTTLSTTPAGTFTLSITGTSGALSHSTTVTLVVSPTANFTLTATPASQTVTQGSATSYTATVTGSGGFAGSVSLSASGLPTGATAAFSPASITGSGSSTMNVTTVSTTPAGTYTLTITGTSGALSHSTTVTLVVSGGTPGFSITATPASQTVTRGNSTSYVVTVTAINGFTGTVTLRARGLPSGANASFSPGSVAGHGTSTMTVTTTTSTSTGTFSVRIRGTSGGVTRSVNVQLVVQ